MVELMSPLVYVVLSMGATVFIVLLACLAANQPTERDARAVIARYLENKQEDHRA
jgi:hypothetical protein